jgi:hypothetical protein
LQNFFAAAVLADQLRECFADLNLPTLLASTGYKYFCVILSKSASTAAISIPKFPQQQNSFCFCFITWYPGGEKTSLFTNCVTW